ncbi:hypothetical protein B0H63DRAFT_282930 [Podospora didyma]|uniref:HNH nuclease domain-containing protein n=1 Tax=Podospora didyma TaxID=330526 RepID=A0AAE0N745_9PEZI|nr:hypothetical protein B0H63DRAFT_282930 [Podospora didyma]
MAAAGGKQPPVTPSPSQSAAFGIELAITQIEGSTRNPGQRWLKEQCLRRDENRCVLSGLIDSGVFKDMSPGERRGNKRTDTECAHILPFALSKLEEKNATQTKNKTTTWWALHQYFPALKNKIRADTVHQPGNAITLRSVLHGEFNRFSFGFRPTNEEHKYYIEILDGDFYEAAQLPTTVTFAQHDTRVPRTDPDILDVHLRISHVLKKVGHRYKCLVKELEEET